LRSALRSALAIHQLQRTSDHNPILRLVDLSTETIRSSPFQPDIASRIPIDINDLQAFLNVNPDQKRKPNAQRTKAKHSLQLGFYT
jgi:hypothetical protein